MDSLDMALRMVLLGLSIIMTLVSVQACRKAGGRRMVWVFISFLGFTALSALALTGEFIDDMMWQIPNTVVLLLLLIIGANYLALLKG
ncbi:MAG: hypothetical protein LUQ09_03240 [Methanomassiliicoccales archaeon]|nr:hypothetical protein [Methanomassiliicoccales archaeon]